jgi:hypothetical protein
MGDRAAVTTGDALAPDVTSSQPSSLSSSSKGLQPHPAHHHLHPHPPFEPILPRSHSPSGPRALREERIASPSAVGTPLQVPVPVQVHAEPKEPPLADHPRDPKSPESDLASGHPVLRTDTAWHAAFQTNSVDPTVFGSMLAHPRGGLMNPLTPTPSTNLRTIAPTGQDLSPSVRLHTMPGQDLSPSVRVHTMPGQPSGAERTEVELVDRARKTADAMDTIATPLMRNFQRNLSKPMSSSPVAEEARTHQHSISIDVGVGGDGAVDLLADVDAHLTPQNGSSMRSPLHGGTAQPSRTGSPSRGSGAGNSISQPRVASSLRIAGAAAGAAHGHGLAPHATATLYLTPPPATRGRLRTSPAHHQQQRDRSNSPGPRASVQDGAGSAEFERRNLAGDKPPPAYQKSILSSKRTKRRVGDSSQYSIADHPPRADPQLRSPSAGSSTSVGCLRSLRRSRLCCCLRGHCTFSFLFSLMVGVILVVSMVSAEREREPAADRRLIEPCK